ncbi:transposase family protein [Streptomyces sp. RKAG337]|nr:transposase family protein [Streptomyces sp. RKAG337]MCM2428703.1 transposase family protein [Streptomyces sp. RKAG337]
MLPDPRRRRGVGHSFVAVLVVVASAVVAGARSYTPIGQWSANAPQHTTGPTGCPNSGRVGRPHPAERRHDPTGHRPCLSRAAWPTWPAPMETRVNRTSTGQTVYAITDLASHQASPQSTRQGTLDHREPAALRLRHRLSRGRLEDPHRPRTRQHGDPVEPGDQHAPRRRTQQHRRWSPPGFLRTLHPPARPPGASPDSDDGPG